MAEETLHFINCDVAGEGCCVVAGAYNANEYTLQQVRDDLRKEGWARTISPGEEGKLIDVCRNCKEQIGLMLGKRSIPVRNKNLEAVERTARMLAPFHKRHTRAFDPDCKIGATESV